MTPEPQTARYFASLYAAPAERSALEALFGIEREVFDSLRAGLDHHVAHSRLQWWREECERAARGGAAHPLTRALIAALGHPEAKSVPQLAGLCGIVDVATWDLASATFATRRELEAYCKRWAAAMIEPLVAASMSSPLAAVSTGSVTSGASSAGSAASGATHDISTILTESASSPASTERSGAWQDLGAAICEVELLLRLAPDALTGRIRLPLDELESAHIDTAELTKLPWPDTVVPLIRGRLEALRTELEHSVANLSRREQQALRGLLVWASLSWRAAQQMQEALPEPPGRFGGISDAWFAWRIARRATVGRFKLN